MKPPIKLYAIEAISYLFILLFTYAAVSKILDFQNFQVQLGQSPLLSTFADYIAVVVVTLELGISLLLVFTKVRILGLHLAVSLMVMFTAYITIILNFSAYIPCSCGGILEELGWTEHLIFNSVFIILGTIAIILEKSDWRTVIKLAASSMISVVAVAATFLLSENRMQKENPFIRRFTPNSAEHTASLELSNFKFYFAGKSAGLIYLGNSGAPLSVVALDPNLKTKRQYTIKLDREDFPFRAVKIKIDAPYFYVFDGHVPVIFKGLIADWKAKLITHGNPYFSSVWPTGANHSIFRSQRSDNGENVLGMLSTNTIPTTIKLEPNVLQKQIDGIFDTDGTIAYSEESQRFIYTYLYRNQYIVTDKNLQVLFRGNTIDTTSTAQLKVEMIRSTGSTKLSAPPHTVNLRTTAYNNLLFNQSGLRGKYESEKLWKETSVIDVYDILQEKYLQSFYVYDDNKNKMSELMATKEALFVISGSRILKYKFGTPITSKFSKPSK